MSSQKKKGMNLERKQNLTGWAFLMPATILIAWMSFYPMIQAFILSLQTGMGINLKFLLLSDYSGADHADPRPDVCFHAEQQRSAF